MNLLTAEMKRSLRELDLGLKGELTITSDMEDLSNSLFFDQVLLSTTVGWKIFTLVVKCCKILIKTTNPFLQNYRITILNIFLTCRFPQHGQN